jgi:hypothetical protein
LVTHRHIMVWSQLLTPPQSGSNRRRSGTQR